MICAFDNSNNIYGGAHSKLKKENINFLEVLPHPNGINNFPRLKYQPNIQLDKKLHWGQRKLLLSEIQFFTVVNGLRPTAVDGLRPTDVNGLRPTDVNCIQKKKVVLYVGSADGKHIPLLADLFPEIDKWHLYDPRPFAQEVLEHPRLITYNVYMTDQLAHEFADKFADCDCYLISDIRTFDITEEGIEKNQRSQEKWVKIIKPVASLLKFKLPYPPNKKYKYLKGDIYFQVWAPNHSAETRLLVRQPFEEIEYDCLEYEGNMSYYNVVLRQKHNSDYVLEDKILQNYIKTSKTNTTLAKLKKKIDLLLLSEGQTFESKLK
jgi:hypothetical protein